jgi:hypothetical protein
MTADTKVLTKRLFSHTNLEGFQVLAYRHSHIRMPTRKDYATCKGGRLFKRPLKRVPLAKIASNRGRSSKRRTSHWGCKECKVALCQEGSYFENYHRNG